MAAANPRSPAALGRRREAELTVIACAQGLRRKDADLGNVPTTETTSVRPTVLPHLASSMPTRFRATTLPCRQSARCRNSSALERPRDQILAVARVVNFVSTWTQFRSCCRNAQTLQEGRSKPLISHQWQVFPTLRGQGQSQGIRYATSRGDWPPS